MEIKEIKSKLSLSDVLKHYHFEPDRNHRLCCPFHEDKTPSLQIYSKTNTWTCFSSNCNAGSGDQIDFIMKLEKISKHEALMKAQELLGVNTTTPQSKADVQTPSMNELFLKQRQSLHRSKNALAYLEERNIDASLEFVTTTIKQDISSCKIVCHPTAIDMSVPSFFD